MSLKTVIDWFPFALYAAFALAFLAALVAILGTIREDCAREKRIAAAKRKAHGPSVCRLNF